MLGFGWCHLRSSREPLRLATLADIDTVDKQIDCADRLLWSAFRTWMATHEESFIQWQLNERLNNDCGLLTFVVSRNHRASNVWAMLDWIATNGVGSYGLLYCHDDEDAVERSGYGRKIPMDYDNVFRVHRLLNGCVTELCDPFFGLIEGNIDPIHPYNRSNHE